MLDVHNVATQKEDHHLSHYLIKEFMDEQLDAMNELGCRSTQLQMVGEGAGLYIYDRNLLKEERRRTGPKINYS